MKHNYLLRFEQVGYETGELTVSKKLRVGILVLDLLFGGVPALIDAITGGLYELLPKIATISLTKINAAAPGPDVLEVTLTFAEDGDLATASITSDAPGVTMTVIQGD